MLAVHLYRPDSEQYRLLNNNYYIPLIPIFDIEEYIGAFGRICISMFLFLSGYGMLIGYKKYGKTALQYSLKKLTDFYQIYWLYFFIFIPIGLIFFRNVSKWNSTQPRYPLDIGIFIQNFIGWSHSYNEEWWFVQLFVLLLIFLCPIYLSLATRNLRLLIFLSSLLFIARIVCNIVWKVEDIYSFPGNLLYWQAPFAVGVIAGEMNLFSSKLFRYFDTLKRVWIFAGVLLCCVLGFLLPGTISDFFLAPFFIYFVNRTIAIVRGEKIFAYLGLYSFPIWLIHSFFCYYYFQDIVYFPRYSPLIFVLLLSMSLSTTLVVERLRHFLDKIFGTAKDAIKY